MTEAELNQLSFIFILLTSLSVHHIYFGKDIPKWSWYLSIFFSIAAGMYLGFMIAFFPGNLILGSVFSLIIFLVNFVVRKYRNKRNTYTFK